MSFVIRPRVAAFTLVELLVAMVVAALLVVILFQIFNVAASSWARGERQVDAFREARGALTIMTRDFTFASGQIPEAIPATPIAAAQVGLAPATGAAPALVLDSYSKGVSSGSADGSNSDLKYDSADAYNEEAYFLTNIPNNGTSSLCAVGYFCGWIPDLTYNEVKAAGGSADDARQRAPRAYALCRQILGSGSSLPNPSTGATDRAGLFERLKAAAAGGSALNFVSLYERYLPPTKPAPRDNSGVPDATPKAIATELASYIWDLQFRIDTNLNSARGQAQALASDSTGPSDHGDLMEPKRSVRKYLSSGPYPELLPLYVEIRFKALSAAAARQLEGNSAITKSDWSDQSSASYTKIIKPSSQQFVARVPLSNVKAGMVAAMATPAP